MKLRQSLSHMRKLMITSLILSSTLTCAIAQDIGIAFSILIPGNFQDEDLDKFNFPAYGWLALVVKDGRWELMPTKVSIENQVVTSNYDKAIALLHERSLTPGKVDTPNMKFSGERRRLFRDDPGTIKMNYKGMEYGLTMNKSGKITLYNGVLSTTLEEVRAGVSLVWAGDLDKDDKLDLIIETETENNATYCLFLSGTAGEKALVKKVGCQFYSG
ncbi:hypothetical protein [Undibacterium fentianense]|uniref:Uncharacterized protein n=1 Tax=Undibacterium fentianense TaxID=2828728 RepID=A0A941ID08_9BURK|nr:hypothetical protein [Undibacterium fentianense]MBR7800794.1 hypothetical protein [Undibacterium fentianense]